MKNIYVITSTAIILLISTYLYSFIQGYQAELAELKNSNQQLEEENDRLVAKNSYIQQKTEDSGNTNNYVDWSELDEKASGLVEESKGKFKKSWAIYLVKESQKYNIDPYLVYELLKVETGGTFNPNLVGPETKYGHAYGMSQFMKNTAPWIADMAGLPYKDELLFDPYYSMQLSLVYLDFLHNEYGNWDKALTAYHRGMGGLKQYIKNNGHAKSNYARTIQTNAKAHQSLALAN